MTESEARSLVTTHPAIPRSRKARVADLWVNHDRVEGVSLSTASRSGAPVIPAPPSPAPVSKLKRWSGKNWQLGELAFADFDRLKKNEAELVKKFGLGKRQTECSLN